MINHDNLLNLVQWGIMISYNCLLYKKQRVYLNLPPTDREKLSPIVTWQPASIAIACDGISYLR